MTILAAGLRICGMEAGIIPVTWEKNDGGTSKDGSRIRDEIVLWKHLEAK